jgi:hypothetical protein
LATDNVLELGKKKKEEIMASRSDKDGDDDPRIYRKTIDARVRMLVNILAMIPKISPIESCGGHKKPGNRLNPEPEGCFRVAFVTPLDIPEDKIQRSISVISDGIQKCGDKVSLEKDSFPSAHNLRVWSVRGEGIHPNVVALKIHSEAKKAGLIKPEQEE